MAWPKGKKRTPSKPSWSLDNGLSPVKDAVVLVGAEPINKKVVGYVNIDTGETIQKRKGFVSDPPINEKPFYDLILGVRRIRTGSFSGLWELVRTMPDGSTKILMDASSKASIMNIARAEIARCI